MAGEDVSVADVYSVPLLVLGLAGASPPFIALGWHVWEQVKPLLIPQTEIEHLTDLLVAQFGDRAMYEIETQMRRAHIRGETAEYGSMLRVMRELERREISDVRSD
jgi:hypothetical protein